jgi:D-alanyl-D-alanine carboxypeptidase/D-alanyl-D-alanine-endopeptidase (penicillin-binding protein 4)
MPSKSTSTRSIRFLFLGGILVTTIASCSIQKQIAKSAKATVLKDSVLQHAHIGISIYDPSANKYVFNHNASKYFVPASNTKIVTCYAAMKFLGDSLPGIRYAETEEGIVLYPTGDPSLLHPDYAKQPVIDFLKTKNEPLFITTKDWQTNALGLGWSWGDYNFYYMVERSALPVYGNVINWVQEREASTGNDQSMGDAFIYSIPEINWKVRFNTDTSMKSFYVQRDKDENVFVITEGKEKRKVQEVPFVTHGINSALDLVKDTIGRTIEPAGELPSFKDRIKTIYSQPTDSVLRPMMYRSDNFFAEQLLLMAAHEKLGIFDEGMIIDTLLATDFKDLPQKPGWADGSGLSRYNLFSPQDFVMILDKMKNQFGMNRLKNIFATGGKGTLSNFYKQDSGYVYAKTGTLSGVVALSGFMYTNSKKLLLFSVLVNNHRGNAVAIRRQVEEFIQRVRARY